jgi:NADH dehydrogenase FAD-containing subunit
MRAAECLEQQLGTEFSTSLTLINHTNALLFTPMLPEVAGSSQSHDLVVNNESLRR